ncbi:MAG TPA: hypothetical protein VLB44_01190 [Kofleriaceae bacterium]|nr:hypothetical protein [Kofleriaceae bacterium]
MRSIVHMPRAQVNTKSGLTARACVRILETMTIHDDRWTDRNDLPCPAMPPEPLPWSTVEKIMAGAVVICGIVVLVLVVACMVDL